MYGFEKLLYFITSQQPGPYDQINLYGRFEPGTLDQNSNALIIQIIKYEETRKKGKKVKQSFWIDI